MGACNFYRRHIHNFTYSSAPLTDLIKKTTPWRWTAREEECFQELKKKIAPSNCLGVPRPKGDIVRMTDATDVGGGGTIYQWQELNPAELTHSHYRTSGLNRDGSLKHDYRTSEWRLVPLGHWNLKWNQACSNYSTYDQELLAGMLVLSSQSRLLGSNPIVWPCDQEPVKSFQKGPPPEKAKLKRWWTYLSQLRVTIHHIPGIKNELSDYISRNNFDALIDETSEALAKEAFQRLDVQLDRSMRTARILEGWSLTDYQADDDVRIRSDTGWYKRVLNALNVEVTTSVPSTHASNPLCERQNRVMEQSLIILMKQERIKDWVRLVPTAVLTMNSQRSSSTGFSPPRTVAWRTTCLILQNPLS